MKIKKIYKEIIILLLFTVIFLILTYPLVFSFSSGIIGSYDSDGPIFLWNAWHLKQSIISNSFNFYTDDILFPHKSSLILHTYTLFQSFLVLLLDAVIRNIVLSFNLVFLLFNVATAYFCYRFFSLHINLKTSSILASIFFSFQALWSLYAIFGTQNLLGLWYIPASVYSYELYTRDKKLKHSILCGLVLGLAFINGTYSFIFSVTGLLLYIFLKSLIQNQKDLLPTLKFIIFGIFSFIIVSAWKIFFIFKNFSFIKSIPNSSLEDIDRIYHADIMNLFRPVQFHSIWGFWHNWFRDMSIENGNSFVGFAFIFTVLLFVVVKIIKKAKFQHLKLCIVFLLAYLLILLLSFGPYLHFFGIDTHIAMPHYFIQKILPFYNSIRVPARWLILAQIFLAGIFALLLNYVLFNVTKKLKIIIGTMVGIMLILDVVYLPRPITHIFNTNETRAYEKIANFNEEGTVMYLPLSISSGYFKVGESTKRPMVYQIIHEKSILGGHLSRLPFSYLDEYQNNKVISYLSDYSSFDLNKILEKKEIDDFLSIYEVQYIVLDKQQIDISSVEGGFLMDFILENLKFIIYYEDDYNIVFILDK